MNREFSPQDEKPEQVRQSGIPDLFRMSSHDQIEQLKALFPEAVAEGKIDWERLRAALGEAADESPERYRLTWAGKGEALRQAQAAAQGALAPAPEESLRFATARHVFVEGDNLEVLRLMRPAYLGRVKMIYIDPPYNTGNDFIYPDDFADGLRTYLRLTGQTAGNSAGHGSDRDLETGGRFHSAWLSMIYPRLILARQLLREDGALCVSIGDREVANLRLVLNEIFGEENYRNTILVRRFDKNLNRQFIERGLPTLNVGVEYVLVYARSPALTLNPVYRPSSERRRTRGYWKGFWNAADRPTMRYALLGVTPAAGQWKWKAEVAFEAVSNYEGYVRHYAAEMTLEEYWERTGRSKRFIRRSAGGRGKNEGVEHWIPPSPGILRTSNWTDLLASGSLADLGLDFDSPKSVDFVKDLVRMCCGREGLVVDFFAGSCTTAEAVLDLNCEDGGQRRCISVQLPEPTGDSRFPTIADLGKERIRRVIARLENTPAEAAPDGMPGAGEAPGLRVFKLAASSFEHTPVPDARRPFAPPGAFTTGRPVEGWQPDRAIWEAALHMGFELDARVERLSVDEGRLAYRLADADARRSFTVVLDDSFQLWEAS